VVFGLVVEQLAKKQGLIHTIAAQKKYVTVS
jgi:hypothetical protein